MSHPRREPNVLGMCNMCFGPIVVGNDKSDSMPPLQKKCNRAACKELNQLEIP